MGKDYNHCIRNVRLVLDLIESLGFLVNTEKCSLVPSQQFCYLGCIWDTATWTVSLKVIFTNHTSCIMYHVCLQPKRVHNIKEVAAILLTTPLVKARLVARFIGRTQSAIGVVPLAKARTRAVLRDFAAVVKSKEDYDRTMSLSSDAKQEILDWQDMDPVSSTPISTDDMSVETLDTDASPEGLGWYFKGLTVSDTIPVEWQDQHINILELFALRQFLHSAEGSQLVNKQLVWRVDNNTALCAIKK